MKLTPSSFFLVLGLSVASPSPHVSAQEQFMTPDSEIRDRIMSCLSIGLGSMDTLISPVEVPVLEDFINSRTSGVFFQCVGDEASKIFPREAPELICDTLINTDTSQPTFSVICEDERGIILDKTIQFVLPENRKKA